MVLPPFPETSPALQNTHFGVGGERRFHPAKAIIVEGTKFPAAAARRMRETQSRTGSSNRQRRINALCLTGRIIRRNP
jgi:hypothetical protein